MYKTWTIPNKTKNEKPIKNGITIFFLSIICNSKKEYINKAIEWKYTGGCLRWLQNNKVKW